MTDVGRPDKPRSATHRLVRYLRYRVRSDYVLNAYLWVAVLIVGMGNGMRSGVAADWGEALLSFSTAVFAAAYAGLPYLAWVASQHLRGRESATSAKRVGPRKPRWVVEDDLRC